MHSRTRPRLGRWAPLAVAVLGSAALAPPAGAAVANISDIIEVSSNTSEVLIGGVDSANVQLVRGGVVIATGLGSGAVGGGEAGLNSDHAPGGCWANGFVPQMLPGDEVHNADNADFITVGDVSVTSGPTLENGDVVLRGTVGGLPLPAGHDLDASLAPSDGSRFLLTGGSSGNQFLSAAAGDGGGSISVSGGTWTARFTDIDPAELQKALASDADASVGMEHDVGPTGGEVTAFHFGGVPGGHGGCSEPYAPNEVTGFDRGAINAGNAASALIVNGKAQPGVTSVEVTLTDRNGATATQTATPSDGAWSAAVPAGSFADGPVDAAITMSIPAGDFAGVGRSITKDTVAPGAPTANAGAGTYQGPVTVALSGENVRYTTDGSTPTTGSQAYSSALRVDRSQTIKAISVDGAGNPSPVAEFAYTIQVPVAAAAPALGAPAAPAVIRPNTVASARLSLTSLRVARRMTLGGARRRGVTVAVSAPNGAKAVRVRLRRGNRTVASVVRRVTSLGVMRITLPGSKKQRRALKRGTYTVQITPGSSTSRLDGVTSRRSITLG